MTTTTPKTADEARKLIGKLTAKRAGLEAVLASGIERRKAFATAAEFGDAAAKASLQSMEAEENSARAALQNLDLVIAAMEQLRGDLQASEAEDLARQRAVELSEATDRLLAVDDEIDDALDHARDLFAQRAEIASLPIFDHARKHNFGAGGVTHEREMGESLLAYFDKQLGWLPGSHHYRYDRIERVADWDSRQLGKKSARMLERGPRAPTPIERSQERFMSGPSWTRGHFGFDSSTKLPETRKLEPGEIPAVLDDEMGMRLKDRVSRSAPASRASSSGTRR
ncbi:hypothetical protein CQ12_13865 [Bradyrhizobium jicamae]|uniref:Uncharacterized protein n=1 Tax=Bradyrhizobium jicamae TaxID=280332 RepID=A0A0R3LNY3_9BRAD|nr:hypothetical protein [Bradyrhizobium jicamae]KRR09569.1 hypothetical protein CQ12_13865 [Bradyrhizobium jicamae]